MGYTVRRNCVLWSMGDASLHGMGAASGALQCGVTHVPWTKALPMLGPYPTEEMQPTANT